MDGKISVAMAVYNGERYLNAQIDSILRQLSACDELVISIDPSDDRSEEMVRHLAYYDKRIRVIEGTGEGVIKNFENALSHVTGDVIFLSDQDDVWLPEKLSVCIQVFETNDTMLMMHDATLTDAELTVTNEQCYGSTFRKGIVRNLIKNKYIGCCMAFRKELLETVLPFPEEIPMHDQWIALVAEKIGKVEYINEPLILYRRHRDTLTGVRESSFLQKLKWRWQIASGLLKMRKTRQTNE